MTGDAVAPAGAAARAVAVVCYLLGLCGCGALAALVLLLGLDRLPERLSLPHPWIINIAWLVLFALAHSGMARARWKRLWTKAIPEHLERSVYAGLSGLLLLGMAATWQVLPGEPLWRAPRGIVLVALTAAAALAWINLRFDHLGLFGVRQVWEHGRTPTPERLLIVGPYRWVRHPLMTSLLVFLWAQPVMPPSLALLSSGLTVYIFVGVFLEERDLRKRFGAAYAEYRRQVPAFFPWRRPAPAASHPEQPLP
jgi:protein-S-isoprenylcysteine O-methyltransferase Ste14